MSNALDRFMARYNESGWLAETVDAPISHVEAGLTFDRPNPRAPFVQDLDALNDEDFHAAVENMWPMARAAYLINKYPELGQRFDWDDDGRIDEYAIDGRGGYASLLELTARMEPRDRALVLSMFDTRPDSLGISEDRHIFERAVRRMGTTTSPTFTPEMRSGLPRPAADPTPQTFMQRYNRPETADDTWRRLSTDGQPINLRDTGLSLRDLDSNARFVRDLSQAPDWVFTRVTSKLSREATVAYLYNRYPALAEFDNGALGSVARDRALSPYEIGALGSTPAEVADRLRELVTDPRDRRLLNSIDFGDHDTAVQEALLRRALNLPDPRPAARRQPQR